MATIEEALEIAMQHHRAGQLREAENVYRQILAVEPDHPDALHLLGRIVGGAGQNEAAAELFAKAVAADPQVPDFHLHLADALHSLGRNSAAAESYRNTLALEPNRSTAYKSLLDITLKRQTELTEPLLRAVLAPPPLLYRLQIEVTTHCNLKCAECPRTIGIHRGTWVNKHMAVEDFRRVVEHVPASSVVVLQGVGESTLHPDLAELIAIARRSGKFEIIYFNTNALARDMDYYRRLVAAGLSTLSVSVDSFDPVIAEACRSGTPVDRLQRRVQEIAKEIPSLNISIVASQLNRTDIPSTLLRLSELGSFLVEIQPVINYKTAADGEPDNSLSPADVEALDQSIEEVRPRCGNLSITLAAALKKTGDGSRCVRPFLAPYVTVDGYLTPCCTSYDPALLGHTNIIETDLRTAWQTPAIQSWLRSYFFEQPSICIGCCFNPA